MSDYTAKNIKVLHEPEFDYLVIDRWVEEYKKPVEFVRRGVEASRLLGIPLDHFENRYLKRNKDIPMIPELCEISRELQIEAYRRGGNH